MAIDELDNLGSFEIDDEVLAQMETDEAVVSQKGSKVEEPKDVPDEPEDPEEEPEEPEDKPLDVEEEDEPDDEDAKIFEKYGEDVNISYVRHYEEVKDFLLTDEDFEFNGKNLADAYEQDTKNRNLAIANNLFNSLPPVLQRIVGTALKDPDGITEETYMQILESGKTEFSNSYSEDDEDSIKAYLRKNLLAEGRDEDDVTDLLDLWEDKGKLLREARRMDEKREKNREKEQAAKINADKEAAARRKENQKKFVSNIDDTLKESKMIPKRQNLIKSYILDRVDGTNDSPLLYTIKSIYNNPKALVMLADMLSYYNTEDGSWDMSKFEKQAVTQQTRKAKRSIEEKLSGSNAFGTRSSTNKKTVDFDWGEASV